MAMSKSQYGCGCGAGHYTPSCYAGCYQRRRPCCAPASSGVGTGTLLAAGVGAAIFALACGRSSEDDDDTITTTISTLTPLGTIVTKLPGQYTQAVGYIAAGGATTYGYSQPATGTDGATSNAQTAPGVNNYYYGLKDAAGLKKILDSLSGTTLSPTASALNNALKSKFGISSTTDVLLSMDMYPTGQLAQFSGSTAIATAYVAPGITDANATSPARLVAKFTVTESKPVVDATQVTLTTDYSAINPSAGAIKITSTITFGQATDLYVSKPSSFNSIQRALSFKIDTTVTAPDIFSANTTATSYRAVSVSYIISYGLSATGLVDVTSSNADKKVATQPYTTESTVISGDYKLTRATSTNTGAAPTPTTYYGVTTTSPTGPIGVISFNMPSS